MGSQPGRGPADWESCGSGGLGWMIKVKKVLDRKSGIGYIDRCRSGGAQTEAEQTHLQRTKNLTAAKKLIQYESAKLAL